MAMAAPRPGQGARAAEAIEVGGDVARGGTVDLFLASIVVMDAPLCVLTLSVHCEQYSAQMHPEITRK